MSTEDNAKLAKRRNIVLVFMGSALAFALLFLILAIRYHAETEKEEQQAAASQAAAPLTPEQQQASEQYARENGEYIDYSDFYAKAESTGLTVGKRYRVRAFISDMGHSLFLHNPEYPQGPQKQLTAAAAFDTEAEHENFLKSNNTDARTIVASMGEDGTILIYKVD